MPKREDTAWHASQSPTIHDIYAKFSKVEGGLAKPKGARRGSEATLLPPAKGYGENGSRRAGGSVRSPPKWNEPALSMPVFEDARSAQKAPDRENVRGRGRKRKTDEAADAPPTTLGWNAWEGSIVPAWRAVVASVSENREVAAVLVLNAGGRVNLAVRIEEAGTVVAVVESIQTNGLGDPESAKSWASGLVFGWWRSQSGGVLPEAHVGHVSTAELVRATDSTMDGNHDPEHAGAAGGVSGATGPDAAAQPPLAYHAIFNREAQNGAGEPEPFATSPTGSQTATIHDIYWVML